MKEYPAFTSNHKIGDTVVLDFGQAGKLFGVKIAGVKFTDFGKVLYDVSIQPYPPDEHENEKIINILKDIDSCRVVDPISDVLNIK